MLDKLNLSNIAKSYLATLHRGDYADSNGKHPISWSDFFVQICIPVVCAIGFGFFIKDSSSLESTCDFFSKAITCISIIASLFFGLSTMVFQMRLEMRNQHDPTPREDELSVVDQFFHIILWAILIGFITVVLCMITTTHPIWTPIRMISASLAIGTSLNFFMVTCMSLKRIYRIYDIISKEWNTQ